jgi:lysophospholipase L1-like esterase
VTVVTVKKNLFLRVLCFAGVSVLVFFVGGEILIRLFYFGPDALFHFRRYEPIVTVSPWHLVQSENPRIAVENRSDYRWIYLGQEVRTNALGLVDEREKLPEHPGQKVIVMMGESYMEGSGVPMPERVSALLEQNLRRHGEDYAVLNMALTNTVLESQIERLKQKVLPHYSPDLVLVSLLASDNWTGAPASAEVWRERVATGSYWYPLWKISFFLFVLEDYAKNFNLPQRLSKLAASAPLKKYFGVSSKDKPADSSGQVFAKDDNGRLKELLAELAALGKGNGFRVALVPVTAMKDFKQPNRMRAFRDNLQKLADEFEMMFIDTAPWFDGQNVRACILWEMNRHPNAYANRVFADGLYAALAGKKVL